MDLYNLVLSHYGFYCLIQALSLSSSDSLDLHCILLAGLGYLRECSVVFGVVLDGSGV